MSKIKYVLSYTFSYGVEKLSQYIDVESDPEYYYHITSVNHGDTISLKPRVPDVNPEWEENKTKRVSVSDSIEGCIISHPGLYYTEDNSIWEKEMYAYRCKKSSIDEKNIVSNETLVKKKLVFDAHVTDEVWVLSSLDVEYCGKILVSCLHFEDIIKFTYKNLRTINGSWNGTAWLFPYKWLDKK